MIIRLADQPDATEGLNPLVMRQLLDAERHGPDLSMTWVQLWGRHVRLRTDASARIYVIVAGTASFQLGDEPADDVVAGDVVLIPRGVPYEFSGYCTYLVMNTPAFQAGDDIVLDAS